MPSISINHELSFLPAGPDAESEFEMLVVELVVVGLLASCCWRRQRQWR